MRQTPGHGGNQFPRVRIIYFFIPPTAAWRYGIASWLLFQYSEKQIHHLIRFIVRKLNWMGPLPGFCMPGGTRQGERIRVEYIAGVAERAG